MKPAGLATLSGGGPDTSDIHITPRGIVSLTKQVAASLKTSITYARRPVDPRLKVEIGASGDSYFVSLYSRRLDAHQVESKNRDPTLRFSRFHPPREKTEWLDADRSACPLNSTESLRNIEPTSAVTSGCPPTKVGSEQPGSG